MKKIKYSLVFAMLLFVFGITNVDALTITEDTTLTDDINEQVVVDGKKVTINLNGHNITHNVAKEAALIAQNGAEVTIKGNGTIDSKRHNGIAAISNSKITLESGNIVGQEYGVFVGEKSTFTMNGGTVTARDNCGIGGNGSDTDDYKDYTINIKGGTITSNIVSAGYISCGVYHPNRGTVNISGGTINSTNGAGVVQRAGVLNITGGTINASETTANIKGQVADGKTQVSAYALVIDKGINYPESATLQTNVTGSPVFNGAKGAVQLFPTDYEFKLDGGVFTEEPAATQLDEGYVSKKVLEGDNKDKYVVVKESELEYEVVSGMIQKDDIEEDDVTLIEKAIKDKYTLVSYYGVLLAKTTKDGDIVEYVSEPTKAVEVTLGLPDGLPAVKEGYKRVFVFVRVHDGKAEIIENVKDNGDKTVSGDSDKFSTYAVAYTDVVDTSNPKTGDNIALYITLLALSVVGFAGVLIYKKKKQYN